jgi:hypothetical protein
MPLESIIDLLGPFLIPVSIFAIGTVGYGILLVLSRRGWL